MTIVDIALLVFGIVLMVVTACFDTVEYIWEQGVTFKKVFLPIAFCFGILLVVLACIKPKTNQEKIQHYQQKIEKLRSETE